MEDKQTFLAQANLRKSYESNYTCEEMALEDEYESIPVTSSVSPPMSCEEQEALNATSSKFDCSVSASILYVPNATYTFVHRQHYLIRCVVEVFRNHNYPIVRYLLSGTLSLKEQDHNEIMSDLTLVWNFIRAVEKKKEK